MGNVLKIHQELLDAGDPSPGQPRYPVLFWGDLCTLWVVYGLVDPREPGRVRYVGRSCDPAGRLNGHINSGAATAKGRWVLELAAIGIRPNMVLLEVVQPEAEGRELWWYTELRKTGEADLNAAAPNAGRDFPYSPVPLTYTEHTHRVVEAALLQVERRRQARERRLGA